MPKGRMLNKKISCDEKISHLSLPATLLFTWCIPHLDVQGRMYGDPVIIKGTVVPYIAYFTAITIKKCQEEFIKTGLVKMYGNGRKYMYFVGFTKNQTLNLKREAPSEIPSPNGTPDELLSNSGVTPCKDKLSKDKLSKVNTVVQHLNSRSGKAYKAASKDTQVLITTRLDEGYTVEELMQIIDNMTAKWSGDEKMEQYLRPSTLFRRSHIEGYLNVNKGLTQELKEFRR